MYGQNNEDQIIAEYFGGFVGHLLDIGANDGITLSNSRLFIEQGWSGVLVEPNATCLGRLQKLYSSNKKVTIVPYGISDKCGTVDFWESGEHITPADHSLISTMHESELDRWKGSKFDNFQKTTIEVIDVPKLLKLCPKKPFDFISIDAEGEDINILRQLNLTDVKCICIEHNSIGSNKRDILALTNGFKVWHQNTENLILVR